MQYRPHRYRTQFPAKFRTGAGMVTADVIDVNNSGARINGLQNMRRGDKIQVEIFSLWAPAVVQWVANGNVGITFRPHITDDQVDILRFRPDGRHSGRPGSVGYGLVEMR